MQESINNNTVDSYECDCSIFLLLENILLFLCVLLILVLFVLLYMYFMISVEYSSISSNN